MPVLYSDDLISTFLDRGMFFDQEVVFELGGPSECHQNCALRASSDPSLKIVRGWALYSDGY